MNSKLAKLVICLHERGYGSDFICVDNDLLLCLQTNREFSADVVCLWLLSQVKDESTCTYKYFYCVEAPNGLRGIMLTDSPIFCKCKFFNNSPALNDGITGEFSF
jgi:hypothetical protein